MVTFFLWELDKIGIFSQNFIKLTRSGLMEVERQKELRN
jgi:hypothetical protein